MSGGIKRRHYNFFIVNNTKNYNYPNVFCDKFFIFSEWSDHSHQLFILLFFLSYLRKKLHQLLMDFKVYLTLCPAPLEITKYLFFWLWHYNIFCGRKNIFKRLFFEKFELKILSKTVNCQNQKKYLLK